MDKLLKRVAADNKEWKPCGNDSVWSEHFVDGIPTAENPNPTLILGYGLKQTKPRRILFRQPLTKKPKKLPASSASTQSTNHTNATISGAAFMSPPLSPSLSCPGFSSPVFEHSYCIRNNLLNVNHVIAKGILINSYKKKLEQSKNRLLKRAKLLKKS